MLPKVQLDAIKLKGDKFNAISNFYQENTKSVRKSQTQKMEELNKVEELARAMETLILKIENFYKINK